MNYGPVLPISEEVAAEKHRQKGETHEDAMRRIAHALADNAEHEEALYDILLKGRFKPAGRVQAAAGSFRHVTAFNCFVSGTIPDSMEGIMERAMQAALTMQKGGGIGYDFSTIRPSGALVKSMDTLASGPVSFMGIYDSTCKTVASAGNRRGAQMAVMRVDHPDIRKFINAKTNNDVLTQFNVSVGVTDEFMRAVLDDDVFELAFDGEVYETIMARELWNEIMSLTWDWAEPGVLFIDRINEMNNLWYCETIAATNPCGEQPLPPFGACLLGSFNWAAYVQEHEGEMWFDIELFTADISVVIRAMDNVIDRTIYPLPEQEREAKNKRRMGLGAMGVANAMEALGMAYGSEESMVWADRLMQHFTNQCYIASAFLANEKGAFPLFSDRYLDGQFIKKLEPYTQRLIEEYGIRNSHLTSIAPTGSISLAADNVSSGIEPPFMLEYDRKVLQWDGSHKVETVSDYGYRVFGVEGRTANEISAFEHVDMLTTFQRWVDSACSKTCNVGEHVTFDEFKEIYMRAWQGGAKGCTTFRASGKRFGILTATPAEETHDEGAACTFDPATGKKTCE